MTALEKLQKRIEILEPLISNTIAGQKLKKRVDLLKSLLPKKYGKQATNTSNFEANKKEKSFKPNEKQTPKTSNFSFEDKKEKLLSVAKNLEEKNLAIYNQSRLENTWKRQNEASNIREKALAQLRIANVIEKTALNFNTLKYLPTLPPTKVAFERMVNLLVPYEKRTKRPLQEYLDDELNYYYEEKYKNTYYAKEHEVSKNFFLSIGLSKENIVEWRNEILQYYNTKNELSPIELEIKELERKVRFANIAGFFPTPHTLLDFIFSKVYLDNIKIKNVLEPSAGNGSIASYLTKNIKFDRLDLIEWNYDLAKLLKLKGFNIVGSDFLNFNGKEKYQLIVMNPPFENKQDIEHVLHALDFLDKNSILIAIMSGSTFQRQDKKTASFIQTLDGKYTYEYFDNPKDSFKNSDVSTGVHTITLIVHS